MGQNLISYMGACTEIPNLGPMFSQTLDSRPSPGDLELWKKVDELWAAHELGPDQPLSLERADPLLKEIFRQQMAKANLTTEASDDILMQIFAQIDEDGSRDIQRAELVNFLKHADVNLAGVAPVQAQQTFGLHTFSLRVAQGHHTVEVFGRAFVQIHRVRHAESGGAARPAPRQ